MVASAPADRATADRALADRATDYHVESSTPMAGKGTTMTSTTSRQHSDDQRLLGRLEAVADSNAKAVSGLLLSMEEFRKAVKEAFEKLAERVTEIEVKLRIGRALVMFVLLLAMLAGYGLKDAIEAFIAITKP